MNISQAAKAVGLSTKQIRDYEKLGLLGAAKRTAAGYRYYEEMDLGRLAFIRHSRDVGFSLQQIEQLLRLQDDPHRCSREVKALTAAHIATLNQQIERLQAMVKELQSWHDSCQGDNSPDCPILAGLKGE
ncbi:MAG: Cu(I)-responsive transcriptional regulator [Haemophilus pittmaniae]|uniref:Cu(I)-responsive transcriptional regulator n=1 Tax=Haemophilus pittmaniae TaxID=249188 RepID=UPI0023F0E706|nr:Cu(I)-responsive transcriptional regulator [Haemophilus pittmaniae]MBS6026148.1 Cu(I)-responsive transcriptional regulator [Haemophilus pittmaniae]